LPVLLEELVQQMPAGWIGQCPEHVVHGLIIGDRPVTYRAEPFRSSSVIRGVKLVLVVAALLASACGSLTPRPGDPLVTLSTGTVEGHAYAAPTCPVQRVGQNCSAPMPKTEIDFTSANGTYRTTTDAHGFYSVQLAPGSYEAFIVSSRGISRRGRPQTLQVVAARIVTADLVYDTGIR
jgi:hypothetical protein